MKFYLRSIVGSIPDYKQLEVIPQFFAAYKCCNILALLPFFGIPFYTYAVSLYFATVMILNSSHTDRTANSSTDKNYRVPTFLDWQNSIIFPALKKTQVYFQNYFWSGLQLLLDQCLHKASSKQKCTIPTVSKSKTSPNSHTTNQSHVWTKC